MVKTIKFFCIAGILALLILFISYTETERQTNNENISKVRIENELDTQSLRTENATEITNSEIEIKLYGLSFQIIF